MQGLDRRLQLLSIDLPGHGESPELIDDKYTVAAMVNALITELQTRTNSPVTIIGHSGGGHIALRAAAEYPQIIGKLVLIDSNLALTKSQLDKNKSRSAQAENGEWRKHFMASMTTAWGNESGKDKHLRESVFTILAQTPEKVLRPLWHDILNSEPGSLLQGCQIPTLYIRSNRNTDLRLLKSINPLVTTVDLQPKCGGHWPHLQQPHIINKILEQFLNE